MTKAKQAEVAIVFATQWTTEGLDVPDLSLPDGQDALISAVVAANPSQIVSCNLRISRNNKHLAVCNIPTKDRKETKVSDGKDALTLFLSHRSSLIRYARRITGDIADAEDIVQEAWLRFRANSTAKALDEPNGYLFRIVQNLALDWQRRRLREGRMFTPDASKAMTMVASDQPLQQENMEGKEDLALLHKALARLPERTRRAFEMHRFEGMKLIEIASELGISKSVASELVIDAVETCKKALKRRH